LQDRKKSKLEEKKLSLKSSCISLCGDLKEEEREGKGKGRETDDAH